MPSSIDELIEELLQIVEDDKDHTHYMLYSDLYGLLDNYTDAVIDKTARDTLERCRDALERCKVYMDDL